MGKIKPGIYHDLSSGSYHGDHGSYSKSSLVDFKIYPYNLIHQRKNKVRKKIYDVGTAAHAAILEPDKFDSMVAIVPPSTLGKNGTTNTNAYREWAASVPDEKAILKEHERDQVFRMYESVMENPAHSKAKELLTHGRPEVSVFWEEIFKGSEKDPETGYWRMKSHTYGDPDGCHAVTFKCRPDYIPADGIVVDLKTTKMPIDSEGFEKHAYSMKYHWSAGMTMRGMNIAGGNWRVYLFVVVEADPPHEVAVFRASQEFIALGGKEVLSTMEMLAYCHKNNVWPGAPNKIQQVGLPGWALRKLNH